MVLLLFIRYGRLEIVQYLINVKHCNTEVVDKDGWTPLHWAVK